MRADMNKVLTERPRRGGFRCYHDVRQRETAGDYDDLPACQGMSRPYGYNSKEFDDLIGPLHRFLHGCVGRLWNDVWSEICQVVKSGNTVDSHLRDHARRDVQTNVQVRDGKLYERGRYGRADHEPSGLYVDPRDGLIHHNDDSYRRERHTYVTVDGMRFRRDEYGILYPASSYHNHRSQYPIKVIGADRAVLINGIWYWVVFANTPPAENKSYWKDGKLATRLVYSPRYDFLTGEYVNEGRYHADKRQMCSRDLKRHGLRNIR